MSGLEQTFYVMAIVYMCIMFLLMIAALGAVLTIKAKINAIHQQIEDKLSLIKSVATLGANVGGLVSEAAKGVVRKRSS
jgi:cell division protein FtsL